MSIEQHKEIECIRKERVNTECKKGLHNLSKIAIRIDLMEIEAKGS